MTAPRVVFASPRKLPPPSSLSGRVVVLDIAFAADGIGRGFEKTTKRFIEGLGPRLARWVDHHDHPRHAVYAGDPRFVLATKQEHGACPEMITPELVRDSGPIETIVCHFDLDGIYSAAKWILGGCEPYPGADDDARAADTRIGEMSPTGRMIDAALRARWQDEVLRQRVLRYLVQGRKEGVDAASIREAAALHHAQAERARKLAQSYVVDGGVAVVEIPSQAEKIDKTELLLEGQKLADVAVVIEGGNATFAAPFDSGIDLVALLELGGGMPTRVSIPAKRAADAVERVRRHLKARRTTR